MKAGAVPMQVNELNIVVLGTIKFRNWSINL